MHCSHSAGVAWKEPWLCYNCFVAPTSKCLACCEPLPMHPFAASSLSHRNAPPAQTLSEFLSYTASLSQENCSALFRRFLTAFKGLLIPVCFKNTEHPLPCSFFFSLPCFRSALVGPIKHPSRNSAHLELPGAPAELRAGRSHTAWEGHHTADTKAALWRRLVHPWPAWIKGWQGLTVLAPLCITPPAHRAAPRAGRAGLGCRSSLADTPCRSSSWALQAAQPRSWGDSNQHLGDCTAGQV